MGLAVNPLFDRQKLGIIKSQLGFFEVVAMPLFQVRTLKGCGDGSFAVKFLTLTPQVLGDLFACAAPSLEHHPRAEPCPAALGTACAWQGAGCCATTLSVACLVAMWLRLSLCTLRKLLQLCSHPDAASDVLRIF